MKKVLCLLMGFIFALSLCGCSEKETTVKDLSNVNTTNTKTDDSAVGEIPVASASEEATELLSGKHNVEISVKDYGVIRLELDADSAPITVTNFIELVNAKFYDGLTFHRIMNGFMMQGGDPTGTGMGGSDKNIKGEFVANGVDNRLSHRRGAVSMARSKMNDSASSQFFIVQIDSTYLDGQYACFGFVTEGMDVVDAVCKDAIVEDNNGSVAPQNQPVIEYIKVIE